MIERQLGSAGFEIMHVWGDWSRTPFTHDSPLLVVEAPRNQSRASR